MKWRYIHTSLQAALSIMVALGAMVTLPSCADGVALARCEREEDLDGYECRVDMLPDEALAEMVYTRGFDPEGATRMQLLEAVLQLIEYEHTTGENLREVEYMVENGGYASHDDKETGAAAAATEQKSAEQANSFVATPADEVVAEHDTRQAGEEAAAENLSPATQRRSTKFEGEGSSNSCTSTSSPLPSGEDNGSSANGKALPDGEGTGDTIDDSRTKDPAEANQMSDGRCDVAGKGPAVEGLISTDTVAGYARQLGDEILRTMKRDLNTIVGLLPSPVAKPIREVAQVACDTTVRVVVPALKQAERYTRGMRRGTVRSAGRLVVRMKEVVVPRMARGVAGAFAKAKRGLRRTISGAGKGEEHETEEVEEERELYEVL